MKTLNFKAIAKRFVSEVLVKRVAPTSCKMEGTLKLKSVPNAWATCRVTDQDGLTMSILVTGTYRSSMVTLTRKELRRLGWGGRHGQFDLPN